MNSGPTQSGVSEPAMGKIKIKALALYPMLPCFHTNFNCVLFVDLTSEVKAEPAADPHGGGATVGGAAPNGPAGSGQRGSGSHQGLQCPVLRFCHHN